MLHLAKSVVSKSCQVFSNPHRKKVMSWGSLWWVFGHQSRPRIVEMIRRRIRAAGQTTVQPLFAPELRRRATSSAAHRRCLLASATIELDTSPSNVHRSSPSITTQNLGEVRVKMPAVVRPHRLIGAGLAANQVSSRPVLADGLLRPILLPVVLRGEIVHVEVDRPGLAVRIGHVERIWTGAQAALACIQRPAPLRAVQDIPPWLTPASPRR